MTGGVLFLVVGPSGAGKDTLLDGAKAALADDSGYLFPQRVITRPADAGGEDHEAVSEAEFAERQRAGGFFITWDAHGLRYGLPASVEDQVAQGRGVIVNVSRSILAEAWARIPSAIIIEITAPAEVLAKRLASRGREDEDDIARRLARQGASYPKGMPVLNVMNDAAPDDGIARFVAAVRGAHA